MIIIPIRQRHVFGQTFLDFFGNNAVAVIIAAGSEPKKHIAPHMRFKSVLCGYLRHFIQMAHQQFVMIGIAVLIHISAAPYHARFIHADVHVARRKRIRKRRKNLFDKRIRFRLVDQQNIFRIDQFSVFGVAHDIREMRQRLHAGDQFNPFFSGVRVDFF